MRAYFILLTEDSIGLYYQARLPSHLDDGLEEIEYQLESVEFEGSDEEKLLEMYQDWMNDLRFSHYEGHDGLWFKGYGDV